MKQSRWIKFLMFSAGTTALAALTALAQTPAASGIQTKSDGVILTVPAGTLRLQVWSDKIIRVTFAPGTKLPADKSLCVIGKPAKSKCEVAATPDAVMLQTKSLLANVDRKTGAVMFFDANMKGHPILQEMAGGREFAPSPVTNLDATSVKQSFVLAPDEHVFGLGQHQGGIWNYRGTVVHLQQRNMEVGVPVLISSKGYGVLWDNPAVTDIDAGKTNAGVLSWTSEAGKAVDYYFMFGPAADEVIQDYRELTGSAPMLGEWFWGFWQCKERYQSQEELTNVVARYRELGVPLDGIIQDWHYWTNGGWGSHAFEKARYPDPAQMVRDLHAMHAHMMISVWARFDTGLPNYNELNAAGLLLAAPQPVDSRTGQREANRYYDAFNPMARQIYWRQMNDELFKFGIDAWWLDSSEPELNMRWGELRRYRTALGSGAKVYNAYPLMHTTSVYQGQRAATSAKRVAILTRSAWAGQQRNAAITWSGDIRGTWDVFARQIPAGLNFSVSGIPYWNTDIGGFSGARTNDARYQELFTRWFQFGAFCPMFRVHGTSAPKEIWRWDQPTQKILADFIRLRYRLLPYIYSVSWQVSSGGGTMMRPLMMDFPNDLTALDTGGQFLFGPALMACPVTKPGVTNWSVYLPGQTAWYDFWTGHRLAGGQRIDAAAPIDSMPLFVRAGAILPMGPVVQYAAEQAGKPQEIRVYRGADGAFTLYDDEADNYNYEKGKYSTIPLRWDDAAGALTIGARHGKFPGMVKERTFRVVFVGEGHGNGIAETQTADQTVRYTGKAVTVKAGN